jgi:predicted MFS family arabinose efflux permease
MFGGQYRADVGGCDQSIEYPTAVWSTMATAVVGAVAARELPAPKSRRVYPWVVFAVSFALLLSDYMSRQALAAVFPLLKEQWRLSDTQLGSLTSVVALAVGVLTVPLSLLADRWGRTRAIVLMAVVWSAATMGSALAGDYGQLLLARLFLGVGEAAYGSVGLAVVLTVFPRHRRASLTGAFMAGGLFGGVVGVGFGGVLAVHFGWRWSFGVMAIVGLVLAALYRLAVREHRLVGYRHADSTDLDHAGRRPRLSTLFSSPSLVCAYVASGLQLCVAGSFFAWMPSYLNRTYQMAAGKASGIAAILVFVMGAGMMACGALTDRLSRNAPVRLWTTSIGYAAISMVLLAIGFASAPGSGQLLLLAAGALFAGGTAGPMGAVVANLTDPSIRSTALGTLTLANNLLGLASGPLVTGVLADHLGLSGAMRFVPLVSVGTLVFLLFGVRANSSSAPRTR